MSSLRTESLVFLKLMIFLFGLTSSLAQLTSYRVENVETLSSVLADGQMILFSERVVQLRIFSNQQLSLKSQISFTNVILPTGSECDDFRKSDVFYAESVDNSSALFSVTLTKSDALLDGYLMFCYRAIDEDNSKKSSWIHQGNNAWMRLSSVIEDNHMQVTLIWVRSVLVPVFLLLSAVFSGLSLTLLSLTRAELKVLRNQGKSEEKRYSKAVAPLRKRGNMLFCGLLLMNTLANVMVAVLLYELIQLYSILAATLLIVFLGEIVPQTICSKYGLAFGNKMSWLTDIFFVLTLPFSYPVGKVMDLVLDDEVPAVYNRDRFQEMLPKPGKPADTGLMSTNQTNTDDIKTFMLSNRTVGDVMVKLDDAYMEEYDSILTSEKVSDILKMGYTRIPVYEKERSNVVALLHVRDLTLIDPKDCLTLKAVCKFYNRPVNFVFEDTKLTVMLEEFKKGQSHMAFVQRVNNDGPGDPYYETLGMVTLEDVIEDIFHSDSVASKQLTGNVFDPKIHFRSSKITPELEKLKFNQYLALHRKQKSHPDDGCRAENLPTNLVEAIKHFLPIVPAFQPELISSSVLERLLKQASVVRVTASGTNQDSCSSIELHDRSNTNKTQPIVEKGRPMDFFALILEGKVQVTIGADNLQFVEGSFSHFGHPALMKALSEARTLSQGSNRTSNDQSEYIPDYTVLQIEEVLYLKVPLSVYLSSLQATQLQRMNQRAESVSNVSVGLPFHPRRSQRYDETFVEANNAKNVLLNYQRSMGFPDMAGYPGAGDLFLHPDFAFHSGGNPDSWNPEQQEIKGSLFLDLLEEGIPVKSPSDEWLDGHVKDSGTDISSKEPASDRSTIGESTPVHPFSYIVDEEDFDPDKKGC